MNKAEIREAIHKLSGRDRDELRHWLDTKQQIEEITEAVVRLTQFHAIWLEIVTPKTAVKYDGVRREYFDFFEPVCHSFFQGFYVGAYQLLDHRSDSKHIHSLIEAVSMNDATMAGKLKAQLENYSGSAKVKTVRHKIFAHRDRFLSPNQVLAKSPILVKEMEETLIFLQDIVSTVVEALGGGAKTVFQVFEALTRDMKRDALDNDQH